MVFVFLRLYDCAYDKGYIGINKKLEIVLSSELKNRSKQDYYAKHFSELEGSKILMPKKYVPRKEFLDYHLDTVFKG